MPITTAVRLWQRILKLQQQEFKPGGLGLEDGGHGLEDGGVHVQVDW